jgi:aspartate/methionine/tyrosine aminotransferase
MIEICYCDSRCGITIGWLAFQDLGIKQSLLDVQYFGTACPSRASEIQAIMVLRASDAILEKNIAIIRHNFGLLEKFMERHSDLFEWVRPKAGTRNCAGMEYAKTNLLLNVGAIAFIKFKGPLSSEELGAQLAGAGISIKPAYIFSDVVTENNDYFRVGYGEEKMPKALDALEQFVEEHKQSWEKKSRL